MRALQLALCTDICAACVCVVTKQLRARAHTPEVGGLVIAIGTSDGSVDGTGEASTSVGADVSLVSGGKDHWCICACAHARAHMCARARDLVRVRRGGGREGCTRAASRIERRVECRCQRRLYARHTYQCSSHCGSQSSQHKKSVQPIRVLVSAEGSRAANQYNIQCSRAVEALRQCSSQCSSKCNKQCNKQCSKAVIRRTRSCGGTRGCARVCACRRASVTLVVMCCGVLRCVNCGSLRCMRCVACIALCCMHCVVLHVCVPVAVGATVLGSIVVSVGTVVGSTTTADGACLLSLCVACVQCERALRVPRVCVCVCVCMQVCVRAFEYIGLWHLSM